MDSAFSAGTGGGSGSYPDSVESSPRSRGGESWDEPLYSSSSPKLRLMCSYGGRIVPRPTDKSLCYLGGDTRIVVVDRNSSFSDLSSRLSRTLLGGLPFSLKYQIPNEDLDSLISVTTDEDLDNMIEEYDRISANTMGPTTTTTTTTKRLRLFLFPSYSESESAPSSIGSLLDDSKSETWFVDALNGAIIHESASVNCLLGLEDVGPGGPHHHPDPDQQRHHQQQQVAIPRPDVQSVPDSPMMEMTSSFDSASSSAPALSTLPTTPVRPDDRPPPDHFNLASALLPQPVPLPNSDNPRPGVVFGVEDDKPDARRPIYYQSTAVAVGNPTREIPLPDPAYRMQPVAESGYVAPTISAQEQMHQFQQQQQQQQQLQFIHTNAHYVQVPYYQVPHPMHQPQQQFQQVPAYYLPICQNPHPPPATGVPLSNLPPNTEIKTTIYRTMAPQARMVHVAAADQGQLYNAVGYHVMHHHHPSQAAPVVNYGYEYANAAAAASATEPVHQQMYYTQAPSPSAMQAQYQTVVSEEANQNRGS